MNFIQAVQREKDRENSLSPLMVGVPATYFTYIFKGSQNGCTDPVKFANVQHICKLLFSFKTEDVSFDLKKISSAANAVFNFQGDTSTAMSLDFIDRFFFLSQCEVNFGKTPEAIITRMRLRYQNSGCIFRARQAAFNTLYKTGKGSRDFYRSQLGCLLMFHRRRSMWSTKSIDTKDRNFEQKIEETVKELRNGLYIIRMEKLSSNVWKEESVRSVVIIKSNCKTFFFDPNIGCISLVDKTAHCVLQQVFRKYREICGIETVRFFEIAETLVIPQAERNHKNGSISSWVPKHQNKWSGGFKFTPISIIDEWAKIIASEPQEGDPDSEIDTE